jgi:hypothetical protein
VSHDDTGGSVIPQSLIDELIKATAQPPIRLFLPRWRPPLTRRERGRRAVAYRYYRVKSYLTHLGLALLNRCDREGYDW